MYRALIVLAALAAGSCTLAGRLFKCVGPDGVTSYQQSECPKTATEAGVVAYQREPDAPETGWLGQRVAQRQGAGHAFGAAAAPVMVQQRQNAHSTSSRMTIDGMHPEELKARVRMGMPLNGLSREAEALRRYENNQGSREGRAMNRTLYGDAPGRRRAPAPPQAAQHPRTITDQHGNRYQQQPGSAFVTDERTGRQCFKSGVVLHCQ